MHKEGGGHLGQANFEANCLIFMVAQLIIDKSMQNKNKVKNRNLTSYFLRFTEQRFSFGIHKHNGHHSGAMHLNLVPTAQAGIPTHTGQCEIWLTEANSFYKAQ